MQHLNIPEEISAYHIALRLHCDNSVCLHIYHVINKYLQESLTRPRLWSPQAAMTLFDRLGLSSHQSQTHHSHQVLLVSS